MNLPSPLKLHLGSGNVRIPGYLNVDLVPGQNIDFVDNVGILSLFEVGTVESIYACHVLEHFSHEKGVATIDCLQVLRRWFDLLKPGGELFVAVPHLRNIFREILRHPGRKESLGFFMALYGGQNYPTNVHYSGYTRESLIELLLDIGFDSVLSFKPFVDDTTQFQVRGVQMSLNVRAVKGFCPSVENKPPFIRIFRRIMRMQMLRKLGLMAKN